MPTNSTTLPYSGKFCSIGFCTDVYDVKELITAVAAIDCTGILINLHTVAIATQIHSEK